MQHIQYSGQFVQHVKGHQDRQNLNYKYAYRPRPRSRPSCPRCRYLCSNYSPLTRYYRSRYDRSRPCYSPRTSTPYYRPCSRRFSPVTVADAVTVFLDAVTVTVAGTAEAAIDLHTAADLDAADHASVTAEAVLGPPPTSLILLLPSLMMMLVPLMLLLISLLLLLQTLPPSPLQ